MKVRSNQGVTGSCMSLRVGQGVSAMLLLLRIDLMPLPLPLSVESHHATAETCVCAPLWYHAVVLYHSMRHPCLTAAMFTSRCTPTTLRATKYRNIFASKTTATSPRGTVVLRLPLNLKEMILRSASGFSKSRRRVQGMCPPSYIVGMCPSYCRYAHSLL